MMLAPSVRMFEKSVLPLSRTCADSARENRPMLEAPARGHWLLDIARAGNLTGSEDPALDPGTPIA